MPSEKLSAERLPKIYSTLFSALFVLEKSQVVPKGSTSVSMLLAKTATYLVKAGKEEIFTPSYFIVAVKPDVK